MAELSLSQFSDKVDEIMPAIMRNFVKHQTEEYYKLKITMPQFVVMDFLHRAGECKMSDIAKSINVTTAAMTGLIDRLVRDGYVIRSNDPEDRRIVNIKLTLKGTRVVVNMIEKRKEVTINMFRAISAEERKQYLDILMHIKDHMKD